MRIKLIAVALLLVTFLIGFCTQEVNAQPLPPVPPPQPDVVRGISVTGTAVVRAAPDIAYVTVGVRTRAPQANRAASENAAVIQRVMQALRQLGIAENDIRTVQYTLQPVFEYPQNAPPRLTGYEATNLVRVTVRDLSQVGRVIDAAVTAGANVVQDVAFSLRNEEEVRANALREAIRDGRMKAMAMAQALDVRLGRLISAVEAGAPIVTPLFSRAAGGVAPETAISPGELEVRATVSIIYSFE